MIGQIVRVPSEDFYLADRWKIIGQAGTRYLTFEDALRHRGAILREALERGKITEAHYNLLVRVPEFASIP